MGHDSDLNTVTADLLSRTAMRDRAGFDALYEIASPKLFGVCMRLMKNTHDAEEVFQESWVRIWQKAPTYGSTGAPAMAWMITLTRNLAIDKLRQKKAPAVDIDQAYDLADKEPDPEENALAADERRQIDHCLDQLDDEKADAVRGAYLEGYSYEELAARFEIPINTMRTWLRRSLIKLRECLEQ